MDSPRMLENMFPLSEEHHIQLKIQNESQIAVELLELYGKCFTIVFWFDKSIKVLRIVEISLKGPNNILSPADVLLDEIENFKLKLCLQDQLHTIIDSTLDLSPLFLVDYVYCKTLMEWDMIDVKVVFKDIVEIGSLFDSGVFQWSYILALVKPAKQEKEMNTRGHWFSLENNESRVVNEIDGKMSSYLYGDSARCNAQNHKESMQRGPMFQQDDTFKNQHKRKETMKSVSSYVATLSFIFSLLSSNYSHPLLREKAALSIGFALLELFSFVVFVWAVFTMITVGAQFTKMQGAMLLFWAHILHIKSAGSITTLCIPILGIFFVGWLLVQKPSHSQMKGHKQTKKLPTFDCHLSYCWR